MKRPKGPELKMPELQVPAFVADLYYDLRDRRLLPLIALVVVAIAATPFLLGQESETEPPSTTGAGAIAGSQDTNGKASVLTVVEARPGLRDYRKRLRGRKPIDPFRQLAGSAGSGSAGGPTATSSESVTVSPTTSESSSTSESTEHSPAPSGSATLPPEKEDGSGDGGAPSTGNDRNGDSHSHVTLYSFGVDVTIVHSRGSKTEGNKKTSEPEKRTRVLPTTSLPGDQKQVVTYMGLSPKTRRPLFLVSTDVTGVFGEGKCVAGSGTCQLVELEPGFPEVFEYGKDGDRYSIKVTDVEFVVSGHV